MGLFDGGAKKEAVENFVKQTLSELFILDDIVSTVVNNEKDWVTHCQSYYDNRKREIKIETDLFQISWYQQHYENDVKIIDADEVINYSFTSSGYTPVHNHVNEKGKEDLSVGRVIYILASVIRERLQKELPDCKFDNIWEERDHSTFTYTVPALTWKRWF